MPKTLPWIGRKVHYWAAIAIALPAALTLSTGVLLQLKKQLPWVQPVEKRGEGKTPALTMAQILTATQSVPEADVHGWEDIQRVDIRPGRGILKVITKNSWEVQVDTLTGAVLQKAYRRSDWIESLHDGSFFGDFTKMGVFLPSGITLLLLWITGLYLFFLPIWVRQRKKLKRVSVQ
jgi:uncharacterized iron-regulated membrane protein